MALERADVGCGRVSGAASAKASALASGPVGKLQSGSDTAASSSAAVGQGQGQGLTTRKALPGQVTRPRHGDVE